MLASLWGSSCLLLTNNFTGFWEWEPLSSNYLSSHRTFKPSYLYCLFNCRCCWWCIAQLHPSTSTTSSVKARSRLQTDFAPSCYLQTSSLYFLIDGGNTKVSIKYKFCINVKVCLAFQCSWSVKVSCCNIMKVGGMSRFCVCGRLKPQRTLYMSALITVCISLSLCLSYISPISACPPVLYLLQISMYSNSLSCFF